METRGTWWSRLAHLLHTHLVAALALCYALAAVFPTAGVLLRDLKLGTLPWTGGTMPISAPMVLLSLLLINSALGTSSSDLRHTLKSPGLILAGVVINAAVPVVFALLAATTLQAWGRAEEVQILLTGLALVGAMPIAGSSTAWAQKGGGNVALSLGLVLGSTAAGPLITPLVLRSVASLTHGDYAERLRAVAHNGGGAFLLISVVIPSAIGLALRAWFGPARIARLRPTLQFISLADLLLLNYANASSALPRMLAQPNWKFLGLIFTVSILLCVFAFWAGAVLGKAFRLRRDDRIALMFALGMNNNGGGLVLASVALGSHPLVQLPLLAYNLVQHLVAATVDAVVRRPAKLRAIAVAAAAHPTTPKLVRPNQESSRALLATPVPARRVAAPSTPPPSAPNHGAPPVWTDPGAAPKPGLRPQR